MAHVKNHDYHILNPSLWPLLGAVAAFVMLFGATVAMKGETTILGGMITISGPWMGLSALLVFYMSCSVGGLTQ